MQNLRSESSKKIKKEEVKMKRHMHMGILNGGTQQDLKVKILLHMPILQDLHCEAKIRLMHICLNNGI